MELKINVSDEKFTELVNKELDALSADELQGLIREGVRQYIFTDLGQQKLISMFVEKKDWSYRGTDLLNQVITKSVNDVKWKELTDELIDKMTTYLKENHNTLIQEMMKQIFFNAFANQMANSWQVRDVCHQIISENCH